MDRYEEALERAKKGLPIDEVFPELKESEDERIRKGLLEIFNKAQFGEWGKLKIKDIIAWLEKQKEQKPVHTAKEMWKEMRLEVYAQASGNRHEPNYSDDSTKMFSLCDIDEIFEKIGNSIVGSQSAEWSEEDERTLESFLGWLQGSMGEKTYSSWLKSLPERFSLKPKQEWSEEDEKNLERVTDCIYDFYPDPVVKYKLKDWLKSLRSQPHWKPSEEQMKALLSKLPVVKGSGDKVQDILESLYNDLKKLM